jgi:hypothetical protein
MVYRVRKQLQLFSLCSQGEPFQVNEARTLDPGDTGATFARIVLPAGKLYVIEYVSAIITLPVGQRVTQVMIDTRTRASGFTRNYFLATRTSNTDSRPGRIDVWIVSQPTRLYAEGTGPPEEESIFLGIGRDKNDDQAFFEIVLSGYLLTRRPVLPGEPVPPDGPKAPVSV